MHSSLRVWRSRLVSLCFEAWACIFSQALPSLLPVQLALNPSSLEERRGNPCSWGHGLPCSSCMLL